MEQSVGIEIWVVSYFLPVFLDFVRRLLQPVLDVRPQSVRSDEFFDAFDRFIIADLGKSACKTMRSQHCIIVFTTRKDAVEIVGWAPYFCTDTSATVRDILEAVAARWAIEEHFHDVKEVWGAGQQQVRNVWSNIGCWHLNQWAYTLVELCCWDVEKSQLSDRSDRSWDNEDRRPSHADRRRSISQKMLRKKFLAALPHSPDHRKLWTLFQDLIALAA